jgi:hypothetical protein
MQCAVFHKRLSVAESGNSPDTSSAPIWAKLTLYPVNTVISLCAVVILAPITSPTSHTITQGYLPAVLPRRPGLMKSDCFFMKARISLGVAS